MAKKQINKSGCTRVTARVEMAIAVRKFSEYYNELDTSSKKKYQEQLPYQYSQSLYQG